MGQSTQTSQWSYRNCPPATANDRIDPTKDYPEAYNEFMTRQCLWDYYGNSGNSMMDVGTMLTESQVDELVQKRQKKDEAQTEKKLVQFEQRLKQSMVAWEQMRAREREDIDIMDITSKYAQTEMTEVLQHDIDGLINVIGQDISDQNLEEMRVQHPSAFYLILYKIFSWLHSLSQIEVTQGDTHFKVNLYDHFFTQFYNDVTKKNGGNAPQWLKIAKTIFNYSKKMVGLFQQGYKWDDIIRQTLAGVSLQNLQALPQGSQDLQVINLGSELTQQIYPQFIFIV